MNKVKKYFHRLYSKYMLKEKKTKLFNFIITFFKYYFIELNLIVKFIILAKKKDKGKV